MENALIKNAHHAHVTSLHYDATPAELKNVFYLEFIDTLEVLEEEANALKEEGKLGTTYATTVMVCHTLKEKFKQEKKVAEADREDFVENVESFRRAIRSQSGNEMADCRQKIGLFLNGYAEAEYVRARPAKPEVKELVLTI